VPRLVSLTQGSEPFLLSNLHPILHPRRDWPDSNVFIYFLGLKLRVSRLPHNKW